MVEQVFPMAVTMVRQGREAPSVAEIHEAEVENVKASDPSPALYASTVWVLVTPAVAMASGPTVLLLRRRTGAACREEREKNKTPRGRPVNFRPTPTRLSYKPRCSPLPESREKPPLPTRRTSSSGDTGLPREIGRSFPHRRLRTGWQ